MQEKLVPAKVFSVNGKATPKHDELLLIYKKDSKQLSEICKEISLDFVDHINNEFKTKSIWVFKKNGKLSAVQKKPIFLKSGYNNLCYISINDSWRIFSHQIEHFIKGSQIYKIDFDRLIEGGELLLVDEEPYEQEVNGIIDNPIISIEGWNPEKALMNGSYYIGSVDLCVLFKVSININLDLGNIKEGWEWKCFGLKERTYRLVFEFKPDIKSFSETLRQVNVYREILPAHYYVITYSDIEDYIPIFKEQEITIKRLIKEE